MTETKDENKGKCATALLHRAMCLLYGAKCVPLLFANTASLESIDELHDARNPPSTRSGGEYLHRQCKLNSMSEDSMADFIARVDIVMSL